MSTIILEVDPEREADVRQRLTEMEGVRVCGEASETWEERRLRQGKDIKESLERAFAEVREHQAGRLRLGTLQDLLDEL